MGKLGLFIVLCLVTYAIEITDMDKNISADKIAIEITDIDSKIIFLESEKKIKKRDFKSLLEHNKKKTKKAIVTEKIQNEFQLETQKIEDKIEDKIKIELILKSILNKKALINKNWVALNQNFEINNKIFKVTSISQSKVILVSKDEKITLFLLKSTNLKINK